jgi:uncharacterized protein with HEPN domain
MSERSDVILIQDILEGIERLERYIQEKSFADFVDDEMMKDAVERIFILIGEAANKISEPTRVAYPKIPWQKMADLRHRVVHEYFGVDYNNIWIIIQRDIPELKEKLQAIKS